MYFQKMFQFMVTAYNIWAVKHCNNNWQRVYRYHDITSWQLKMFNKRIELLF